MTTSKKKAHIGQVKGIIAPDQEGYIDITDLPIDLGHTKKTLGEVIKDFVAHEYTLSLVSKRLEAYRLTLKGFLEDNGYDVSGDDIVSLITAIKTLDTLNPTDTHSLAILEDGYVKDVIDFNLYQILRNADVPDDLAQGYYKIESGKIVLDELRKEELEGLE
jgi:hypothetical protein